jgi:hypothetical protein
MLRSILAVLGGWAVVGVLVVCTDFALMAMFPDQYKEGVVPPDHLAGISLATSTLWSVVGGWVCALIAVRKPWHHLVALMVWGEILGIATAFYYWGKMQSWYLVGLPLLWIPAIFIGGWIKAGKPAFTEHPPPAL